jgi:hypothetical protein
MAMRKAKGVSGEIVGTENAGSGVTAPARLPWDDQKVRDILGATADTQAVARGGLIFAMDATASRQPTWDKAIEVQASMFSAFAPGLKVQLVYFRGSEFYASPWSRRPEELATQMRGVACVGGLTKIGYVLSHAHRAGQFGEASTLVYVGDHMEEVPEDLATLARKLRSRGVVAFMFQEGGDATAAVSFEQIAGLTKGAYCRLGDHSAADLKALLSAAAAYATGGMNGLARLAQHQPAARLLLTQMK